MKLKYVSMLVLSSCGILSSVASADMAITMTGNLIIPSCVINNNSPLNVVFGNVYTVDFAKVNTAYYPRDVVIPIDCPYSDGTPMITISATSIHSSAEGAIQTSKYSEGLVVYLRQAGGISPITIGTPVDATTSVNAQALTINTAVGVTTLNTLTPGSFTATANLYLAYE